MKSIFKQLSQLSRQPKAPYTRADASYPVKTNTANAAINHSTQITLAKQPNRLISALRPIFLITAALAITAGAFFYYQQSAIAYPADEFVTTWKTDNPGTSNSTSITIPTTGGGYNYSVDWDNDGIADQTGLTGSVTHDYGTAGTYTVRIKGAFPRIYFNDNGDKSKILSVDQWGTNAWTSMGSAFFWI